MKEEVIPVGKAAQAQAGRDRARDARLKAARERRLKLDPDQLARERRIDEASVDVEVAWEERAQAEQAVADAELRPRPPSSGSWRRGSRSRTSCS